MNDKELTTPIEIFIGKNDGLNDFHSLGVISEDIVFSLCNAFECATQTLNDYSKNLSSDLRMIYRRPYLLFGRNAGHKSNPLKSKQVVKYLKINGR